jgi:hypothetical protein
MRALILTRVAYSHLYIVDFIRRDIVDKTLTSAPPESDRTASFGPSAILRKMSVVSGNDDAVKFMGRITNVREQHEKNMLLEVDEEDARPKTAIQISPISKASYPRRPTTALETKPFNGDGSEGLISVESMSANTANEKNNDDPKQRISNLLDSLKNAER